MASSLLSVTNLNVVLADRAVILSVEVHQGDSLAIIGPNGAGKTVLLKAFFYLLPASA